jgi:hypothetical protein
MRKMQVRQELVKTVAIDNSTWKELKRLQLEWDKKTAEDVIKELLSIQQKVGKKG